MPGFKWQKWRLTFMMFHKHFWHLKCQNGAFILPKLAFKHQNWHFTFMKWTPEHCLIHILNVLLTTTAFIEKSKTFF